MAAVGHESASQRIVEVGRVRKCVELLEESQFWPAQSWRAYVASKVGGYLFGNARRTLWYRDWPLDAAAYGIENGDYTVWRQLPILQRSDLQNAYESFVVQDAAAEDKPLHWLSTSGSTGEPVVVAGTTRTNTFWKAITIRDHLWHNRQFHETLGAIRSFHTGDQPRSEGVFPSWGNSTDAVFRTGRCYVIPTTASLEEQKAWLLAYKPAYLLAPPLVVEELGRLFARSREKISGLKEIRCFGGCVERSLRELCLETFGAKVTDVYSAEEVGYIALQCPVSGFYHIQAESLFVEVLKEDGALCQEGEIGRVVVTTLQNGGMPLIRYELGDYAEVGPVCSCGRTLPTLRRIIGRKRNMFIRPDGSRYWPHLQMSGNEAFRARQLPIQRFQVVQTRLDTLVVNLQFRRPLSVDDESEIQRIVHSSFPYGYRVKLETVTEFSDLKSGKFEDFRCEVMASG